MKITLEQVLDKSNARLYIGPDTGKKSFGTQFGEDEGLEKETS